MDNPSPIITAPLSSARRIRCDERWLITRVEAGGRNIKWVPGLAPSPNLFRRYLEEWKGRAPEEYWPVYAEIFQEELKTEEKLGALRNLWRLSSQGITVGLFCYCPKPEFCHRSLVGDFLRGHGAQVIEYVPQQIGLFGE